ncbi:MAG: hypothetical protein ACK559_41175, partial [bacterium]
MRARACNHTWRARVPLRAQCVALALLYSNVRRPAHLGFLPNRLRLTEWICSRTRLTVSCSSNSLVSLLPHPQPRRQLAAPRRRRPST